MTLPLMTVVIGVGFGVGLGEGESVGLGVGASVGLAVGVGVDVGAKVVASVVASVVVGVGWFAVSNVGASVDSSEVDEVDMDRVDVDVTDSITVIAAEEFGEQPVAENGSMSSAMIAKNVQKFFKKLLPVNLKEHRVISPSCFSG
jgi:hypothetical protein